VPYPPIEPPSCRWRLPRPRRVDRYGLAGVGADLAPGTLLAAYRAGLFPMPLDRRHLGWWAPDPRGVIPLDGLRVSRSLRRSCRTARVTVDTAFDEVIAACSDPGRPHGWINGAVIDGYTELHRLGWAHSVETRTPEGDLVGGLYGVAIDGLFAGESMFHQARDASKVALVALVGHLRRCRFDLLDVQWVTPHLTSLGAVGLPAERYRAALAGATVNAGTRWRPVRSLATGPSE
jgi:leucyl/phenylalanyl-tRNA--protein transferase